MSVKIGAVQITDKEVLKLFESLDPSLKGEIVSKYLASELISGVQTVHELKEDSPNDLSLCHSFLEVLTFIEDCTEPTIKYQDDMCRLFESIKVKYEFSVVVGALKEMVQVYEGTWRDVCDDQPDDIYDTLQKLQVLKALHTEYLDLFRTSRLDKIVEQ